MPRKKQSTNDVRDLQKQVKNLQQALADLETQRLADIDVAAETGYELGLVEAEEKELRRAKIIAEAVVDFEKSYETKAAVKAPVAKKAGKRRGRPAKNKKRAKKARASVPAEKTVVELPAPPVPETGEVVVRD